MALGKSPFSRKDIIEKSLKKAWVARVLAKLIDFLIVGLFCMLFFPLGLLLGVAYLSVSDFLGCGQSVGKSFLGIRVIDLETGEKCDWKQSIIRNLPLTIPISLCVVPVFGWFLGLLLLVIFGSIEFYLSTVSKSTQRLGDMMAGTTVLVSRKDKEHYGRRLSWFEPSVNPCEN